MTHQSVYAIAISEAQANQIVDGLTGSGFSSNYISTTSIGEVASAT